jgi:ferredoxin-NADP reductase
MRVLVEGPYGRLTAAVRRRSRLTLIASGIGITPMRALLEAESYRPGEATLVYRAGSTRDLTFRAELDELAAARGVRVVYLVGRRGARGTWLPAGVSDDVRAVRGIAPDLAGSDVFVCGPEPWMDAVVDTLRRAGVPSEQVHRERFSW